MDSKKKIIEDFLQKPSRYTIDVIDNSMLPKNLQERPTIDFEVKPPTLFTLGQCADVLVSIPQEVMMAEDVSEAQALKYLGEMVKVFCLMSWAKETPYPDWYEPFLYKNLKGAEMFQLFKEIALKSQTNFFLSSLKMVNAANPMTMPKWEEGSTPTDSSET